MALGGSLRAIWSTQDAPKTPPRLSSERQGGVQEASKSAKTRPCRAQVAPKIAQDASKSAKTRPRRAQDAPKIAQDVPKSAKMRSRRLQERLDACKTLFLIARFPFTCQERFFFSFLKRHF